MKNLIVSILFLYFIFPAFSQENTFQSVNQHTNVGFYTSININPGLYFHQIKIITGPELGVAIGNFHMGWYFNTHFMNSDNDTIRANTFFHGITMGYSILGKQPIHPLFKVYAGIGEINYKYRNHSNYHYDIFDNGWDVINTPIFVVTPELSAEMNVSSFMKLNLGFYYRFISTDYYGDRFTDAEASGFGGIVRVSFGKFSKTASK